MSAGLLLDGLLLLVVALYVPIGAWRGGVREAALGGALLLGAATATAWASPWGDALADASGLSESTSRFLAAVAAFVVLGLGLGFAAGVIAGRRGPDPLGRLAGGLFGLVNVLFALATLLAFVSEFLASRQPSRTVDESRLADLLVERRGWLFLAAVPIYALAVAACRWALRFDDDILEQPAAARPPGQSAARRARSVGVPVDPDGGKVEPGSARTARGARPGELFGGFTRSTREIVPPLLVSPDFVGPIARSGEPTRIGGGRSDGAVVDAPVPPVSTVVDDWLRRAADQGSPRSSVDAGGSAVSFTGAALSSLLDPGTAKNRRAERRGATPVQAAPATDRAQPGTPPADHLGANAGSQSTLTPIRRCRICGTPAVSELARCPFCGADL